MTPTADEIAVRAQLSDLLAGFIRTQSLAVAARLGVADVIGDEPWDVGDIAREVGAHEPSLYRLLRFLAGEGVFEETEPRRFRRTRLSDGLRSSAPLTVRYIALAMGAEQYRAWAQAPHSFVTGEPGFDQEFGLPYFEFLAQQPEASEVFNRAMAAGGRGRVEALIAHDWAPYGRVADIGGGTGTAIAAVLAANVHLTGVLFDRPTVVGPAHEALVRAGVADRCEVAGGDFFTDPLPAADAYLLTKILHDWNDERAGAILDNCRRSIGPEGTLLVVDDVMPSGADPGVPRHMDLHMLVIVGGQERTEEEWRDLLAEHAFELTRVVPAGPTNLIEARPV